MATVIKLNDADMTAKTPEELRERMEPEACPTCRRYTTRGREQLALKYRSRPLSGIDLSRPLSEVIQEIRSDIAKARGKLNDISMGFTGWRERIENVEGLLTCGLIALHNSMEEMRKWEQQKAASPKATP